MGDHVKSGLSVQGDPEDRKAVLSHKQWVQEEEERLLKLRQDWVRRRDQKRKAADRKRQIKKQKVGCSHCRCSFVKSLDPTSGSAHAFHSRCSIKSLGKQSASSGGALL